MSRVEYLRLWLNHKECDDADNVDADDDYDENADADDDKHRSKFMLGR